MQMFSQYIAYTLRNHYHVNIRLRKKEKNRHFEFTAYEYDIREKINQYLADREPHNFSFFVRLLLDESSGVEADSDAEVTITFKSLHICLENEDHPVISFAPDGDYSIKIDPIRNLLPVYTLVATSKEFESKLRAYIPLLMRQDSLINVLLIVYDVEAAMYQPIELWINIYFGAEEMPLVKIEGDTRKRVLDFQAFIQDLSQCGILNEL